MSGRLDVSRVCITNLEIMWGFVVTNTCVADLLNLKPNG